MRICILASGSKGNCTYIESENSKILIDAGLSKKEIVNRLSLIKVSPNDIDAILVTHEHSDHIKGLENFAKEYKCKVYGHRDSFGMIEEKCSLIPLSQQVEFCSNDFNIKDLIISPFDLDHDSNHCVGFSVMENGKKFTIATDLGHMTPEIEKKLKTSDFIVLESNHDILTLKNNPNYSYSLKQRILSKYGHISNDECSNTILNLIGHKTRGVMLAHLSEQNNSKELAINEINKKLIKNNIKAEDFNMYVGVATQNNVSNIFKIK